MLEDTEYYKFSQADVSALKHAAEDIHILRLSSRVCHLLALCIGGCSTMACMVKEDNAQMGIIVGTTAFATTLTIVERGFKEAFNNCKRPIGEFIQRHATRHSFDLLRDLQLPLPDFDPYDPGFVEFEWES